jgi:5'-3' exoribonuclease 1
MARATDIFDSHADASVKEVKSWLKSKGIRDLEPVSLFSDNLAKVCQSH